MDKLRPRAEPPHPDTLRAPFEALHPLTVGVEEEVMLLDARTLDLAPRAPDVLAALGGDPRFKLEMPAAHLEIVLPPLRSAAEVATALLDARRALAAACAPLGLRPAAAGVHPFAAALGELNPGPRYAAMLADFGDVARSQLVCALQVHVAVRPADRAMAVYNALREHLPLLAALAANSPVYEGRDTGLASVRPTICERLPQQGMPPALTWESLASSMTDPARWWWELRPHVKHGTLEIRVPDSQATVAEAAAIVAVAHALVATLGGQSPQHEGDSPPNIRGQSPQHEGDSPPNIRGQSPQHEGDSPVNTRCQVRERCGARHVNIAVPGTGVGSEGLEADRVLAYTQGVRGAVGERLRALLDAVEPAAAALGGAEHLREARAMVERGGGAQRQRAAFAQGGARAAALDLAERFLA